MTPLSFEWQWNIEYLIFMGLLYLSLVIIVAGIIYTCIKTWTDLKDEEVGRPPRIPYRSKNSDY
jgi:hypothetical protein